MTENEAWARASELNRELGNRLTGHGDPSYDDVIPEDPGNGYFVAREVSPGEWEPIFDPDHDTPTKGFFRRLGRGVRNVLGELLIRP